MLVAVTPVEAVRIAVSELLPGEDCADQVLLLRVRANGAQVPGVAVQALLRCLNRTLHIDTRM